MQHLGNYDTETEAARAYNEEAVKLGRKPNDVDGARRERSGSTLDAAQALSGLSNGKSEKSGTFV